MGSDGVGRIVVEGDRSVPAPARVMLPREQRFAGRAEARALASQPPPHPARAAVDLIDGLRVAPGDQDVAVGLLIDRVHVNRIPDGVAVLRQRLIALRQRDVAKAVHSNSTAPLSTSTSCTTWSYTMPSVRPPIADRSRGTGTYAAIHAVPRGVSSNS